MAKKLIFYWQDRVEEIDININELLNIKNKTNFMNEKFYSAQFIIILTLIYNRHATAER